MPALLLTANGIPFWGKCLLGIVGFIMLVKIAWTIVFVVVDEEDDEDPRRYL